MSMLKLEIIQSKNTAELISTPIMTALLKKTIYQHTLTSENQVEKQFTGKRRPIETNNI